MLKIYFKSNCSTCQKALSLLRNNSDEEYEIIEYLVDVPTEKEIKEILKMLGMKAEDLVRRKEKLFREKYEGRKFSNAQWIKILQKNPVLIERPILVKDGKALIGRPIERILDIIN